jgi:hypothetical protein
MINKNSFSLYKSALLWLVVIVLSVTTGAGSVYASAPAPTVGDILKSAENYLKGTGYDFPGKLSAAFWLEADKKPALYQELKGKLIALRSQDGTSNTLAHKIVSDIAQGVEGLGRDILRYFLYRGN